jgi:PilZ domain-containing protein
MEEHREHPRFETVLDCEIAHGDRRMRGHTHDLSRGGISVEVAEPIEVSSVVDLALSLVFSVGAASEPLDVKAVIVWCTRLGDSYQVGAKFALLSHQTRSFLDVFLKFLDGSLDPLEPPSADGRRKS